ncbi:S-methyl-5-thioribose-1-phosphate isomerase [Hyphomicrobium methylovorum]|uniref:S-methyl-5-thioribose-1-phosphate isomerase n=1 Tax=Hyphomicrobium methylovorum TaxID=84 RepID=UPI0015E7AAA5|nr:S-methyl-5-thioribose-1-phosphate isomerase [Hyphomicrobium methylovorum]MBA2126924.1 S-methyl-5-thioribose-1-phosphate isomerase [Hyphomicrobium methylovorum]
MKIDGVPSRTIWLESDGQTVGILDQTRLPHEIVRVTLRTVDDAARAIKSMQVRGAPLIGVAAAYGVALAMQADASDAALRRAVAYLAEQRPTAINLRWALDDLAQRLGPLAEGERRDAAFARAGEIAEEDVESCRRIGVNGLEIIRAASAKKKPGEPVNILTHCNAGWLACVDWGTATSPIYHAHDAGIPVHVWVDETRPRSQGAALTAFELLHHGVPHSLIVDNAGGHFMQRGDVDLVIVGTDRVTAHGDVANKIGTYLKALAAYDNGVPFYVALPYSTIDWSIKNGVDIPIEERGSEEVLSVYGRNSAGEVQAVSISAEGTPARNPAFDVTPSRLVSGLITERGVCASSHDGLLSLYPEKRSAAE